MESIPIITNYYIVIDVVDSKRFQDNNIMNPIGELTDFW